MRKPPVTSLISAQRPVSSSASSQRASCCGNCALPSVDSVSMTVVRLLPKGSSGREAAALVSAAPARCAPPPRCGGGMSRPHQRDGLGQIADIIVGQLEQHRVGAFGDQAADQAGFGMREGQRAGQRGERPAALGIGGRSGNSPSSAAACCCGRAHRRGGREVRRSGSCRPPPVSARRRRPRRHSRRYRAAALSSRGSCTSAPARPPGRG